LQTYRPSTSVVKSVACVVGLVAIIFPFLYLPPTHQAHLA
jgi:hypothetical protein